MPAYMIVYQQGAVRDPAELAEYERTARLMKLDIKPKPLAIRGRVHGLEGEPPQAVILMEFPTVDAAMAWYNSPAYQAVLAHRKKAADFQVTIVEGI